MQRTGHRQLKYRALGRVVPDDDDNRIPAPEGRRWPRTLWAAAASDVWQRRLLAAILIDAIAALREKHPDGLHCTEKPELLRLEARRWVKGDMLAPIVSFPFICTELDLDEEIVRKDLLELSKR